MGAIDEAKAFRLETEFGSLAFPKVMEAMGMKGH